MPALFVFLLKVNIALLLFCAGYYLVLRHLTFYTLNRIYLIAAILFATVYPQINLDGFAQRHQQIAGPVQVVVSSFEIPARSLVKPLTQPAYWVWLEAAFWLGAIVLALRLLTQLFSLYKLHRASVPMQIRDHKVRIIHGNANPFSFWRSIYVNPANHTANDLKAILQHEQIHVNEWHTLDVLLAEISTIFYWFNPGIWLMKRAVKENIEFITDRKIVNNGIDAKQYQYSLVNVSFAVAPQSIVNHFNISTIKKRIIMMNAKKSSNTKLTRYAFVLPAVIICLLTFSFSKAELIKKSKNTYKAISTSVNKIISIEPAKPAAQASAQKKDTLRKTIKRVMIDTIRISRKGAKDSVQIIKREVPVRMGSVIRNFSSEPTFRITTDSPYKLNNTNIVYITSGHPNAITTLRLNGVKMNNGNLKTINGSLAVIDTLKADGKIKTINGHVVIDTIFMPNANTMTLRGSSLAPRVVTGFRMSDSASAKRKVFIKNINVSGSGVITRDGEEFTGHPTKLIDITIADGNNETNIDHLSAKLIFIDGKEATAKEFKKLSAADIESMTVKSGTAVTKEYGDKAKSGVLMITTKKSK